MNLTKKIKADLLEAVLKDQFSDLFDDWYKSTCKIVNDEMLKLDGGVSKKIIDLIKNSKTNVDVGMSSTVTIKGWDRWHGHEVATHLSGYKLFSLKYQFECSSMFVRSYECSIPEKGNVAEAMQSGISLIAEINECKKHLLTVLESVRTDGQLKALTKVFNPFLPKEKPKGQLVPSASIDALSKLKSPKRGK